MDSDSDPALTLFTVVMTLIRGLLEAASHGQPYSECYQNHYTDRLYYGLADKNSLKCTVKCRIKDIP